MRNNRFCPDTDLGYECTVTLEICPWVKAITHPFGMDNVRMNIQQIKFCLEE